MSIPLSSWGNLHVDRYREGLICMSIMPFRPCCRGCGDSCGFIFYGVNRVAGADVLVV